MGNKAKKLAKQVVQGVMALTVPDAALPTVDGAQGATITDTVQIEQPTVTTGASLVNEGAPLTPLQRYRAARMLVQADGNLLEITNKRALIVAIYITVCKAMGVDPKTTNDKAIYYTGKLCANVPYVTKKGHGKLDEECKGELTVQGNKRYADFIKKADAMPLLTEGSKAWTKASGTGAHLHAADMVFKGYASIECPNLVPSEGAVVQGEQVSKPTE
jgi:hypothetical protein